MRTRSPTRPTIRSRLATRPDRGCPCPPDPSSGEALHAFRPPRRPLSMRPRGARGWPDGSGPEGTGWTSSSPHCADWRPTSSRVDSPDRHRSAFAYHLPRVRRDFGGVRNDHRHQGQTQDQDPSPRGPRRDPARRGGGDHARAAVHPGHRQGEAHPGRSHRGRARAGSRRASASRSISRSATRWSTGSTAGRRIRLDDDELIIIKASDVLAKIELIQTTQGE